MKVSLVDKLVTYTEGICESRFEVHQCGLSDASTSVFVDATFVQ